MTWISCPIGHFIVLTVNREWLIQWLDLGSIRKDRSNKQHQNLTEDIFAVSFLKVWWSAQWAQVNVIAECDLVEVMIHYCMCSVVPAGWAEARGYELPACGSLGQTTPPSCPCPPRRRPAIRWAAPERSSGSRNKRRQTACPPSGARDGRRSYQTLLGS